MDTPRLVIVGIGNRDRGDDAAGRMVADALRGHLPDDVLLLEHDGEMAGLLALLQGHKRVILIDAACDPASAVGTWHRYAAHDAPLPASTGDLSSHGHGLAEALELARALGDLPAQCIVYAITGSDFRHGVSPCAAVQAAVTSLATHLLTEPDEVYDNCHA